MRTRQLLIALATAAPLFVMSATAQASLVFYNTQASYLAAVSDAGTDDFNDMAAKGNNASNVRTIDRSAGSYSYTSTISNSDGYSNAYSYWPTVVDGSASLASGYSNVTFTFNNFSDGVGAIGGNFFTFKSNSKDVLTTGITMYLTAVDAGGSTLSESVKSAGANGFFGFVSTADLVSLSFSISNVNQFGSIDNLTLATSDVLLPSDGSDATANVPEPASLALVSGGLLALGVARRRGKA